MTDQIIDDTAAALDATVVDLTPHRAAHDPARYRGQSAHLFPPCMRCGQPINAHGRVCVDCELNDETKEARGGT